MQDFIKRAGWVFLAGLFVVTALGVGVLAFWEGTHPQNTNNSTTNQSAQSQPLSCANDPTIVFNAPTGSTKIAGTQLSDYTPTSSIPALQCTDVKVGSSGQAVQSSSTITANYTGAVAATGKIFQSSLDNNGQPFQTALSQVIAGWQKGLLGMKAGGERRLYVPAAQAYGSNPPANSGIPANANLVFDITVLQVQ